MGDEPKLTILGVVSAILALAALVWLIRRPSWPKRSPAEPWKNWLWKLGYGWQSTIEELARPVAIWTLVLFLAWLCGVFSGPPLSSCSKFQGYCRPHD